MTEALAVFGLVSLLTDLIFVWRLRDADKRLQDTTRLFEGIVERMADDSRQGQKAHDAQVSELLTRIQAPDTAPFMLETQKLEGPQHVGIEDDEAYWKMVREQTGMNGD